MQSLTSQHFLYTHNCAICVAKYKRSVKGSVYEYMTTRDQWITTKERNRTHTF